MANTFSNKARVYMRGLRIAAGLSQNKLARNAGIDPAFVNMIERKGKFASRDVILRVIEACQADEHKRDRALYLCGHAPVLDYQTMYHRLTLTLQSRFDIWLAECVASAKDSVNFKEDGLDEVE